MTTAESIYNFWHEAQVIAAVVLGMLIQFAMGDKRGFKIALIVAMSSVFVALFIVPAIIEISGIDPAGKVSVALYALSAIMSVELLAVFIKLLPKALSIRTKRFLGVENDIQE